MAEVTSLRAVGLMAYIFGRVKTFFVSVAKQNLADLNFRAGFIILFTICRILPFSIFIFIQITNPFIKMAVILVNSHLFTSK
jgi:hypothetical protein